MYLDRLKKYNAKLNNVVTLTEDLALAQAAQADKEIRAGKYKGPLHGIPWGAKDLFATKGIPTTWGAAPYEKQVFDYDATVVERLRDAGAVLVAKLSLGALAQGDRWFRGQTKNPWNPDHPQRGDRADRRPARARRRPPASSASRSAPRRAARSSPRQRSTASSACGRPTAAISRHGAMALSWTMDKIGPMCRSVEDCALVFNAIYGPDGRDDTVVDAPFAWNPDVAALEAQDRLPQGGVRGPGPTVPRRGGRRERRAEADGEERAGAAGEA